MTSTRSSPAERSQPHPAVAHREIRRLHQRIPEVGGERGVFERGLAPRTGAEQHDARVVGVGRRDLLQRGAQGAEERGEAVHLGIAVEAGEDARDHHPVLERVARARRRLGVVGQHRAVTGAVTGEVDRGGEQLLVAGHPDLVARAQEAGVGEDELGRQHAAAEQVAWAVEIGEDQVEQLGALDHPELDGGPLVAGEQHRKRIEPPGRGSRRGRRRGIGAAVDVVGDTVVVEEPRRLGPTVEQLVEPEVLEDATGVGPVVADPAVGREQLVVGPGQWPVRGEEIGRRADGHVALGLGSTRRLARARERSPRGPVGAVRAADRASEGTPGSGCRFPPLRRPRRRRGGHRGRRVPACAPRR